MPRIESQPHQDSQSKSHVPCHVSVGTTSGTSRTSTVSDANRMSASSRTSTVSGRQSISGISTTSRTSCASHPRRAQVRAYRVIAFGLGLRLSTKHEWSARVVEPLVLHFPTPLGTGVTYPAPAGPLPKRALCELWPPCTNIVPSTARYDSAASRMRSASPFVMLSLSMREAICFAKAPCFAPKPRRVRVKT